MINNVGGSIMKELDQSKRIIPVMMRWPDAWVNVKQYFIGEDEYDKHLIDHKAFQKYRKLIEYYNVGVRMENDGEIIIKVPEVVGKEVMMTQNRWIKSNASYGDFIIVSIDRDSMEFDRAILCYCAKPSSKDILNDDDYIIDENGARYLNLKFKGRIIESKDVDDLAKEWLNGYQRFVSAFDEKFEDYKDMNDIMRKRFSGKTNDEIGIIPIFVKFPAVVHPRDTITGDSTIYRHILELYTTEVFGDPEHSVLNLTIPKEVANKAITFHNEWINVTHAYGGGDTRIMFISVRKKDYKFIDAWECVTVFPRPETISENDITDNGLILKFSAQFVQSRDIDKIAKEYLKYAKDLNERIDNIGTI